MALDERLESVARGVKTLNDSLQPILQSTQTPTSDPFNEEPSENVLLRKHATFMSEWESVQDESEVSQEVGKGGQTVDRVQNRCPPPLP
jgi:hypothetical protein